MTLIEISGVIEVLIEESSQDAGGSNQGWLTNIAIILLGIFMVVLFGRLRKTASKINSGSGLRQLDPEEIRRLKDTLDKSLVEAEEHFRTYSGVLSTKTALLEELIAQADTRIKALEKQSGETQKE
ncbi:MAG: hypothetical protein NUW37_14840 [Planctomycetes bacterium]|nr:hypothetical protein [Planctomycetota bacterium]